MKPKLRYGLLITLAVTSAVFALWAGGLLDRGEAATWSWRVQLFARPGPASYRIKIVLLDQAGLDWGREENALSWPWPREVYAPLIAFLRRGGARAIAFDVIFSEPSKYGVYDDQALAEAIAAQPDFALAVNLLPQGGRPDWPLDAPSPPLRFPADAHPPAHLTRSRCLFPVPELQTAATLLADVGADADPDAVIRRTAPLRFFSGRPVPSLGLSLYLLDQDVGPARPLEAAFARGFLHLGDRRIPVDRHGRLLLRYRGHADRYGAHSAAALIQSELRLQAGDPPVIQPGIFTNALVLFGFSAPGLFDLRPTPLSRISPGVLVHATLLDNLLTGDALRDAPPWAVALGLLLLTGAITALALILRRPGLSGLAFAAALAAAAALAIGAYAWGWWYPLLAPLLAVSAAFLTTQIVNYATEGRQKAAIKKAFRHYLSPDVIERVLANPDRLRLGGERRGLSIFFSDLEGFSSLSEKLDPEALTTLLNDYLTDMTDIILEAGGTLDKYEGDAIIAFWNAPLEQPDHARRAVGALLDCQRKLAERQPDFAARTGRPLRMRIGLHTGEVIVGNMGSARRFDYTVLGDAANLASRLEGANKAFQTYSMVSEATWRQAAPHFSGRLIGRLRVVGRQTPVAVYEPWGPAATPPPPWLPAYETGLDAVKRHDWTAAANAFAQCADDPVAATYRTRCLAATQAAEPWDGIWNLTAK